MRPIIVGKRATFRGAVPRGGGCLPSGGCEGVCLLRSHRVPAFFCAVKARQFRRQRGSSGGALARLLPQAEQVFAPGCIETGSQVLHAYGNSGTTAHIENTFHRQAAGGQCADEILGNSVGKAFHKRPFVPVGAHVQLEGF